ncbi:MULTISPECIES: hypothetical protein [Actinomyces]|uniref:Uncharacterized protein n=1 Tax=Actinomyces respiraculi TaxID=2744574 RepID=A0A7T0PWQ0_9ACTO|nr:MULTISPECIES: hypothetical protein [Actinomyces]QPL04795.1 hypothetical protein ID810_08480 [Actinomyces respiraculi]
MYVLTIDQIGSRSSADRVPEILGALADLPVLAAFERTVGDELQGVVPDAVTAVTAARRALAAGGWHIGLGVGRGALGDGGSRTGSGPAFLAAREAVEASKRARVSLAVRAVAAAASGARAAAEAAADAQAVLRLLGAVITARTPAQQAVVALLDDGLTGKDAAARLGVSGQAVSKHRIGAGYDEEIDVLPAVAHLVARAEALAVAEEPHA